MLATLRRHALILFFVLAYALTPGSFLSNTPFYLVIANTVGLSILHTWIFAHVRGSIFIAILFHAWNNTLSVFLNNWLPIYRDPWANVSILLVQYLLAAGVILYAYPFQQKRKKSSVQVAPKPML